MTFSKQFIEIIDAIAERIGVVVDWTSKNTMPYLEDLMHRLVKFEIASSIFWLILLMFVLIGSIIAIKYLYAEADGGDEYALAIVVLSILCFFSLVGVCNESYDIIEANILPEKVIIQNVENVLKDIK